jgi:hypothetical protein
VGAWGRVAFPGRVAPNPSLAIFSVSSYPYKFCPRTESRRNATNQLRDKVSKKPSNSLLLPALPVAAGTRVTRHDRGFRGGRTGRIGSDLSQERLEPRVAILTTPDLPGKSAETASKKNDLKGVAALHTKAQDVRGCQAR